MGFPNTHLTSRGNLFDLRNLTFLWMVWSLVIILNSRDSTCYFCDVSQIITKISTLLDSVPDSISWWNDYDENIEFVWWWHCTLLEISGIRQILHLFIYSWSPHLPEVHRNQPFSKYKTANAKYTPQIQKNSQITKNIFLISSFARGASHHNPWS